MDKVPASQQITKMSEGVVITTPVQRDKGTNEYTAKTLPCHVTPLPLIYSLRIKASKQQKAKKEGNITALLGNEKDKIPSELNKIIHDPIVNTYAKELMLNPR
jgi:hypothetical protein